MRCRLLPSRARVLAALLGLAAFAQGAPPSAVLFENVRVFDGRSHALSAPSHVLVQGNRIARISRTPIPVDAKTTRILQGGGRTLMPGLIDAHWHAMMAVLPETVMLTADPGYLVLVAGREARNTLMRGFTTVRDLSGPVFGLKQAIDTGVVDGPRIWPSGAMISQTGGHGDFRLPYEVPKATGVLTHAELGGSSAIADSPDEVRLRAREQFMRGAVFLKLAAWPPTTIRWTRASTARPSSGRRWRWPRTWAATWRCTPTPQGPSRRPSGPACAASSTAS